MNCTLREVLASEPVVSERGIAAVRQTFRRHRATPPCAQLTGASLVLWLLAFVSPVSAQRKAPDLIPLFQNAIETSFLEEAKAGSDRAKALESRHSYLAAAQEYEAEITRAQESSILSTSYSVTMVLADAHLDAARARMKYADTLQNLGLHEQNQSLITGHLVQIPGLVTSAAQNAGRTGSVAKFKCRAYELLGHGSFLQGSLNRSSHDIELAIQAYRSTLPCDPEAAPHTEQVIAYLKSVDRDMRDSIVSNDNIAKMVSKVVSLSVGPWGDFVSAGIDGAYEYIKAHRGAPPL